MELGKQIKKYRTDLGLSQDQLAEKVYVSRQSISNWENDKTYPDIKSLLLLGEVFSVSLDQLVKGDLEEMKKEINTSDIREFNKLSIILTACFLALFVSAVPLLKFLGLIAGGAIWVAEWLVTMYFAVKTEKLKKRNDVQTYREIVAFMNGESIEGGEKIGETAKRPYQKVLAGVLAGLLMLIVCGILGSILFR